MSISFDKFISFESLCMFENSAANNAKRVFLESLSLIYSLLKKCSKSYLFLCFICLIVLIIYPVLEVLIFKFAVEVLVLQVTQEEGVFSYPHLFLIVLGTAILYLIRYVSRVGRIDVVNKLFRLSQKTVSMTNETKISKLSGWVRLVLLEVTFLIISFLQLLSLIIFAGYIDSFGGVIAFLMSFLSLFVMFVMAGREYMSQKKLRYNKKVEERKGELQIRSRIKASEWASFYSSIFSLVGFVAVLILGVFGYVGGVNILVLSLLIRFSNSLLMSVCASAMRLIRAYVYSEAHMRIIIKRLC